MGPSEPEACITWWCYRVVLCVVWVGGLGCTLGCARAIVVGPRDLGGPKRAGWVLAMGSLGSSALVQLDATIKKPHH